MDKLDAFVGLLGVAAYFAILFDLRSYESKVAKFEEIQENRRKYAQVMAERHMAELARTKAKKEAKESISPSTTEADHLSVLKMLENN